MILKSMKMYYLGIIFLGFKGHLVEKILLSSEHGVFLITSKWWSPSIHFKYTEWQSFNIFHNNHKLSSFYSKTWLTTKFVWSRDGDWHHLLTVWPMAERSVARLGPMTASGTFSNSWHSQLMSRWKDFTIITTFSHDIL